MQSFMITTVLVTLASLVVGFSSPIAHDAISTSAMTWVGPSKGVNVTLYGTAQQIMSQLKALDSEWIPMSERIESMPNNTTGRAVGLNARSQSGDVLCCPVSGQDFQTVYSNALQQAAQALIDIGGACLTSPDSCALAINDNPGSQAACDNGAGIYLCDNTSDEYIGANCADIGNYANNIIDTCLGIDGNSGTYVCGQVFDTEGYNVIANHCG